MKRNVGPTERYLRVAVGVLLGLGAALLPVGVVLRVVLAIVGLAGILTGIGRYCPLNQMLRIDNYSEPIEKMQWPPTNQSKAA